MAEEFDLIVIGAGYPGHIDRAARTDRLVCGFRDRQTPDESTITFKKLLGAHIIGEQASELIHIASHVMLAGGPIDAFIDAVYNYPTPTSMLPMMGWNNLRNGLKRIKNES